MYLLYAERPGKRDLRRNLEQKKGGLKGKENVGVICNLIKTMARN